MKRALLLGVTSAAFGLSGSGAYAAVCSNPNNVTINDGVTSAVGGADTTDFTFRGSASDACLILGENTGAGNFNLGNPFPTFGGDSFVRLATEPDASDSLLGLDFTLSFARDSGNKSGSWTLSWTGGPESIDLALAIHAGGRSGVFLFNDQALAADSNGTGTWRIEWLNNGGQIPDFSNIAIYGRQGDVSVPEPAALALLGLGGLLAAAGLRCNRRRI